MSDINEKLLLESELNSYLQNVNILDDNLNLDLNLEDQIDEYSDLNAANRYIIHPNGYLEIVIGCMFSGKTTYIINECRKWQRLGKRTLMINYALDKRYSDEDKVMSHDKIGIDCLMTDKLVFDDSIKMYDIILINEGQFFSDLKNKVKYLVDDLKKIVIVSGLDGDFLRCKFGDILDLIPDCDELIKLKAYCSKCSNGTEAIFSWKIVDNSIDQDVVMDIGHNDKYVPLCRKHYNQERRKQEYQTNKQKNVNL